ncbi:MAG: shikimate kinase [Ruminococcus sp.]|nr:shikimate kinase [Ruminococcus sp.]
MKQNIVLIGMPGVGKSTVGVILAKILGYKFIDTDLVIQDKENCLLKDIINSEGVDGFIKKENEVVSHINAAKSVIATGGSVVYGVEAMNHLAENGKIIYLKLDYDKLEKRLSDIQNRGVVIRAGQTLAELYNERAPLYEKCSDVIIDENDCSIEKTVNNILSSLSEIVV